MLEKSRICCKCGQKRSLKFFSKFVAITKSGKILKRRTICYDCNYKHQNRILFSDLTDEQKLERLEKRFNEFVIKKEGCWDWKGFVRPDGYTRMRFGSRTQSIGGHVASWMIHYKKIKRNSFHVLHNCDNRKCTNPEHLFLGTRHDNMVDMVKKGRHKQAKLTIDQVKSIKKLLRVGVPISKIAIRYDVHWATINDIKQNKTWKFVK